MRYEVTFEMVEGFSCYKFETNSVDNLHFQLSAKEKNVPWSYKFVITEIYDRYNDDLLVGHKITNNSYVN
jgi:hypothetical protein